MTCRRIFGIAELEIAGIPTELESETKEKVSQGRVSIGLSPPCSGDHGGGCCAFFSSFAAMWQGG